MKKKLVVFWETLKTKPLGIKIVSALFLSFALFCAYFIPTIAGIVCLPLFIVFITLSIGIYKMKVWAHTFTGAFLVVWILFAVSVIAKLIFENLGTPGSLKVWVSFTILVAIIFLGMTFIPLSIYLYLKRPNVKEYFK